MKKTLCYLFCLLSSTATYASPEGFYINLGIGGIYDDFESDEFIHIVPPFTSINAHLSPDLNRGGAMGSVGVGYAKIFKNLFILGIEAQADWENLITDQGDSSRETFATVDLQGNIDIQMKNTYAVFFKPGYLINPQTQLYGFAGVRWGNYKASANAALQGMQNGFIISGYGERKDSGYKAGFTAGLGAEYFFSNGLSVIGEYAYTEYGQIFSLSDISNPVLNFTSTMNMPYGAMSQISKISSKTNTLQIKVAYHFS